tara:strand:- start:44 stop:319 length:276 start_codon:yes stop_codon:yes gene_type:complete
LGEVVCDDDDDTTFTTTSEEAPPGTTTIILSTTTTDERKKEGPSLHPFWQKAATPPLLGNTKQIGGENINTFLSLSLSLFLSLLFRVCYKP